MPTLPTYDSTKVSSLTLNPNQMGTASSGVDWSEKSVNFSITSTVTAGFSFDFSITNESEQGFALSPRIPFTSVTNDLAGTGETSNYWTLQLVTGNSSPLAANVRLYGRTTPNPSAWSGSTNPAEDLYSGDYYLISTVTAASSNWTSFFPVYKLTWQLDFLTDYTVAVASGTGATLRSPLAAAVNNSVWNGLVQFAITTDAGTLYLGTSGTYSTNFLSYAGNTHAWHTGAMGYPMRQRGRVVHDHITGQPYFSTLAVPDGYRDGIMVHPDNYDPPDPLEESPWTPPPTEGVVDDELIDVEN